MLTTAPQPPLGLAWPRKTTKHAKKIAFNERKLHLHRCSGGTVDILTDRSVNDPIYQNENKFQLKSNFEHFIELGNNHTPATVAPQMCRTAIASMLPC
jgi:transglutaminase/protease-like cytokinesis protein 3